MHIFIGALGIIQILIALVSFAVANSAIQEVFVAVMFGSGSICLGLATIIHRLSERPVPRIQGSRWGIDITKVMPDDELVKVHRGKRIFRSTNGSITVDGSVFSSVTQAEEFIDQLEK